MKYGIIFISFVLAYLYVVFSFIKEGFGTLEMSIFSIFILLTMVSFMGISENANWGWLLSSILFAFLLSYFVLIFLRGETVVRLFLMSASIISFLASLSGILKQDILEKELEELNS